MCKMALFLVAGPFFRAPFIKSISAPGAPGGGGLGGRASGGWKATGISTSKSQEELIPCDQGESCDQFPLPLRRWILLLEAGIEKCDRIDEETDSRFLPSRRSTSFREKELIQRTFYLLSLRFFFSQLSYPALRRPRKNTTAGLIPRDRG